MGLTLEQLATQMRMTVAELDEIGLRLTCPYCPSDDLRYTPMAGTDQMMVVCEGCNDDDVDRLQRRIRLYQ